MWPSAVAALCVLPLPFLASAAPVTETAPKVDYDVIIVGGGPAGLAASSALGRVRRNVLMVDSGEYRNAATRHIHDVLGSDGVTGAYYRFKGRQQVSHYGTVDMINGTVTKITPQNNSSSSNCYTPQGGYTLFTVTIAREDNEPQTLTTFKVVIATGLKDLVPDTPGLLENWGKGIYWCPWCDGYEHADQPLGLLGPMTSVPGTVREVLTLNRDLVAFVNGTDTPSNREAIKKAEPNWQDYLRLHNVTVDNRTIASIERLRSGVDPNADPSLFSYPEYDLFRVHFVNGPPTTRAGFITNFKKEQRSSIGQEAGVVLLGEKLGVDPAKGLVTSVPGIHAVGDCNSDNSTNVAHALYSGKKAAVFLHVQLQREIADRELSDLSRTLGTRSLDEDARSLWDRMNGDEDDLLYAGPFDQ
ncbi:Pyridine nucleotide-disulfide oxidoreductase, class-II [Metarhizium album ARSEF 1941]|uniref:Pyridine nucleotide-disulfide oxidoreductase, class-II n=1 Tax=Metarhizium album (strain ARSEF 1941) TaxID=1081103 RepID=A0A0B2X0I0_METAS|nr:Pyridine nucleotide-disulfide oxidoreductase, class-II [Metarhizium album ARSEF 1941]KHN99349.1 Pyridine nucleotide-disulfide oxidoreductase, class-II [Metarhizium album ARSEF 1941]